SHKSSSYVLLHDPLACSSFLVSPAAAAAIYTLSLHDALPILSPRSPRPARPPSSRRTASPWPAAQKRRQKTRPLLRQRICQNPRSEEHTSELQSRSDLVCRLPLEKKKNTATAALTPCMRTALT